LKTQSNLQDTFFGIKGKTFLPISNVITNLEMNACFTSLSLEGVGMNG
jgi:hypothetical protein